MFRALQGGFRQHSVQLALSTHSSEAPACQRQGPRYREHTKAEIREVPLQEMILPRVDRLSVTRSSRDSEESNLWKTTTKPCGCGSPEFQVRAQKDGTPEGTEPMGGGRHMQNAHTHTGLRASNVLIRLTRLFTCLTKKSPPAVKNHQDSLIGLRATRPPHRVSLLTSERDDYTLAGAFITCGWGKTTFQI